MKEEKNYNLDIKNAVEEMKKNSSDECFIRLMVELIIRINDEGTVPTPFQNEFRVVWGIGPDTELSDVFSEDENMGNKIVVIATDNDRCEWLPLYTSREELRELAETNTVREVPIREIVEQALCDDEFSGIIIKPRTDGLVLHKEALKAILKYADDRLDDVG